jgi:pyridoxamine 5'-phosphate oxidase
MSLSHSRSDYLRSELSECDLSESPAQQLRHWLDEAEAARLPEPHSMMLSTCDVHGFPAGRIVLLRALGEEGLTFYTNRESAKGQALLANPRTSATFFWPTLERQVRVLGVAEFVPDSVSDAYFASRPRDSQLGAWASPQSARLASRADLESLMQAAEARFAGAQVTRPPHWGGYLIRPLRFEFWQGRKNRLHDRIVYARSEGRYERYRLAP